MQPFILPLLVALLALSLNSFRTTTDIIVYSNIYQAGTTHDNTMADAWIPIRNKGRGIAPLNKGGRGPPIGGRNAVDPMPAHAATGEGSPIDSRLSTSLYSTSTTDDTLAFFSQVKQKHPTHHNITVSPKHVIKILRRPHTPKLLSLLQTVTSATFTPVLHSVERRH
jgi:hypothetical protein